MAKNDDLKLITKEWTDKGKLIEAGWLGFAILCLPEHASKEQLEDMRVAFFAGAQHLYNSIMTILEEGQEPTEADLERMSQVYAELEHFRIAMQAMLETKGSA